MYWREFEPFVMPFVVGCPIPTLEHHARLVAVDWCRSTLCYLVDLDPIEADGNERYTMEPPTRCQVVKVKTVFVDDMEFEVVTQARSRRLTKGASSNRFCRTDDLAELVFNPAPEAGKSIEVFAAVAPDVRSGTSLPSEITNLYAGDLAEGIIASIMRVPNQSFSNLAESAVHQGAYESRRSTVAAKVARGLAGGRIVGRPGFL